MNSFFSSSLRAPRVLAILAAIITTQAQAIFDTNSNGMSDLWEKKQNNGNLFPNTFLATNDDDKDGWTNAIEAIAGTNPFEANPPDGIVAVTITPSLVNGAFTLTWPTLVGKNYQLQFSTDLLEWSNLGTPVTTTQNIHSIGINTTQPDNSIAPKVFWRVNVTDLDTDLDSLTNAEENTLGTNPYNADTDGDTLNDIAEILAGFNPLHIDTDLDGVPDNLDATPLQNNAIADPDNVGLQASLATDLIGSWDFETLFTRTSIPTGHTPFYFEDQTSANRDATSFSVTNTTDGMVSKSANHTQTFSHINRALLQNRGTFTISLWAKIPADAITNNAAGLFTHHNYEPVVTNGTPNWGLISATANGLWLQKNGSNIELHAGSYHYTNWQYINSQVQLRNPPLTLTQGVVKTYAPGVINDDRWHHIVMTRASGTTKLYVDNILQGSSTDALFTVNNNTYSACSIGRLYGYSADTGLSQPPTNSFLFKGKIDRIKVWSHGLTTTGTTSEVAALFQQDIDNDGLWDITELKTVQNNYVTSVTSHPPSGTPLPATVGQYIRSPYYFEEPATDTDGDGLSDIIEQTHGTDLTKPDTDGDGLLDGWEVEYNFDPLVAGNDATADTDGDGLTNLQEYYNNTHPRNTNTDGSGGNDRQEVIDGSDPADSDNDTAPPASEMENVPITINGDYTKWEVVLVGLGPDDRRVRRFRMDNYNTTKSTNLPIRKGNSYELSMIYQSTIPGQEVPWYCWEAKIDGKTDESWIFKNHWLIDNQSQLLAQHTHSQGSNQIADKKVIISSLDILADTNRDGAITNDDRSGKDNWTRALGAIYAVNFDRDGNLTHNERPVTDSVMWWEQEGVTEHEDWNINGEQDKSDITPLRITVPDMPSGTKVYLVVKTPECLRAMHLFSRIKADSQAIWGGFNDAERPWTDDDTNPLDREINQWLQPLDGEQGHSSSNEKIIAGDYEFGVEGLLFRGMKVPNGTLNEGFGGYLEFTLEVKLPNEATRKVIGAVKMKVAPFLLTHNDRPTDQVFVQAIPLRGLAEPSEDPQNPPPVMPKAARLEANVVNQWMQDHVEIGYTQRPGGPLTVMTLACPYARGMAEWARDQLLADGKGLFALSKNLGGSTGDFGGNIELTHPQTNASLGKIIVGNNASEKLRNFFIAQEEQPLIAVNVSFADAAHVDEIISFGPNQKTYVPDPTAALQHLRDTFTTPQSRLEGVLFCTDQQRAKTSTVFATVQNQQQHYIITSLDYDTHQAAWQPYVDGRLRIVGSNAAGGAQVAYIDSISKATAADHPDANVAGKMKISVAEVWNTAQTNPNSRAMQDWNVQTGAPQANWHTVPAQGATIVCVKKSLLWLKGCPAVITVEELLNDAPFTNFNETILPPLIQASATSTGTQNSTGIPCLFFQQFDINRPNGWGAVALTPNAVNLQWVDGVPVLPLPFGPRNLQNADTIQQLHTNLFPTTPPIFLNDWSTFHRQSGEIHCGSAAKRVPTASWWNQ